MISGTDSNKNNGNWMHAQLNSFGLELTQWCNKMTKQAASSHNQ